MSTCRCTVYRHYVPAKCHLITMRGRNSAQQRQSRLARLVLRSITGWAEHAPPASQDSHDDDVADDNDDGIAHPSNPTTHNQDRSLCMRVQIVHEHGEKASDPRISSSNDGADSSEPTDRRRLRRKLVEGYMRTLDQRDGAATPTSRKCPS